MKLSTPLLIGAVWLFALLATWALARLAPRLGLQDAGDSGRKLQRRPLATVGGTAIALTLALLWFPAPPLGAQSGWSAAALLAAWALGLVDDRVRGGLRPATKLAGQGLAGLLLAAPYLLRAGQDPQAVLTGLALVGAALVAMNGLNTFDNADSAAGGLALLGLLPAAPLAAAAVAGFLPWNLGRRRAGTSGFSEPLAILGDSGSHLLGMALLVTPGAWPILALPLFDLARVCVERMRCGQAPWVGDRRHLAHRLATRGLSPGATAAVLLLVAAPSALLGRLDASTGALTLWGMLATLLLATLALYWTRTEPRPRTAALEGALPGEACREGTRAG